MKGEVEKEEGNGMMQKEMEKRPERLAGGIGVEEMEEEEENE